MSNELLQTLDVTIRIVSSIAILTGLWFTARQIKNAVRIHTENLDWNRRKAAQDALLANNQNELLKHVREAFDYNNINSPLPLDTVLAAFARSAELQNATQRLLDMYEAFSRGILQSVYDEEVIKNARKNSMIRAWTVFQTFITHRRGQINPKAWSEFESLVNLWRHQDTVQQKRNISVFEKTP